MSFARGGDHCSFSRILQIVWACSRFFPICLVRSYLLVASFPPFVGFWFSFARILRLDASCYMPFLNLAQNHPSLYCPYFPQISKSQSLVFLPNPLYHFSRYQNPLFPFSQPKFLSPNSIWPSISDIATRLKHDFSRTSWKMCRNLNYALAQVLGPPPFILLLLEGCVFPWLQCSIRCFGDVNFGGVGDYCVVAFVFLCLCFVKVSLVLLADWWVVTFFVLCFFFGVFVAVFSCVVAAFPIHLGHGAVLGFPTLTTLLLIC